MIVRCGRCRSELEVSGPGEFICPACGTRNAVRGADPGQAPAGFPPSVSGLTLPGGAPAPSTIPPAPAVGIEWVRCVACRYRFAIGTVEAVTCPNCGAGVEPPAGDVPASP